MPKPLAVSLSLRALLLACVCLLFTGTRIQVSAQQFNRPAAQQAYDEGLKLLKKGSFGKALRKAEEAVQVDRDFAPAWLLKSNALVGLFKKEYKGSSGPNDSQPAFLRLKEAADTLDQYLRLVPYAPDAVMLGEMLYDLRVYAQLAEPDNPARTLFRPKETTTKARFLDRPAPHYPAKAYGTTVLLGVLAADGRVKHLMVLKSSGSGAADACLKAARGIEFTPALKDGRPVSTLIQIEYNYIGF